MEIIPAVIPQSIHDIRAHVAGIYDLVRTIHLDFCDGKFAGPVTWPANGQDERELSMIMHEEDGMPYWNEVEYEFHLMCQNSVENMEMYQRLGPRRIIFHLEAEDTENDAFKNYLEGIDLYIRDLIEFGIAIKSDTPLETLYPYISHIDFVQIMSIEKLGSHGEPFLESSIDRVRTLHEKYPDLPISVDGGEDFDNVHALKDAGATRLVIGGAIWKSGNARAAIEEFESMFN